MIIFGILNGTTYGLLLFLLASGLTLVFGMLGVLNLAHASFYMLGAYIAFEVVRVTSGFWVALMVAPLLVAVIGALIERFLLRRVHVLGHGHQLLLTLGISYIVLECVKWYWGTASLLLQLPDVLKGSVELFMGSYPIYRLFICVAALVVFAALAMILFKTRMGMIVRAAVSDSEMVSVLGFNVGNIFTGVFALGAFLAGIAGVIAAPMLSVYPGMAADILVDLFVVVIIGGLESLRGALVASLLLGWVQSFGVLFLPDFAMLFSFALMVLVLLWRPLGLFGERSA
jgi:branched-chain amino acid transport system permease protein